MSYLPHDTCRELWGSAKSPCHRGREGSFKGAYGACEPAHTGHGLSQVGTGGAGSVPDLTPMKPKVAEPPAATVRL
jgi:hypothetical protein